MVSSSHLSHVRDEILPNLLLEYPSNQVNGDPSRYRDRRHPEGGAKEALSDFPTTYWTLDDLKHTMHLALIHIARWTHGIWWRVCCRIHVTTFEMVQWLGSGDFRLLIRGCVIWEKWDSAMWKHIQAPEVSSSLRCECTCIQGSATTCSLGKRREYQTARVSDRGKWDDIDWSEFEETIRHQTKCPPDDHCRSHSQIRAPNKSHLGRRDWWYDTQHWEIRSVDCCRRVFQTPWFDVTKHAGTTTRPSHRHRGVQAWWDF